MDPAVVISGFAVLVTLVGAVLNRRGQAQTYRLDKITRELDTAWKARDREKVDRAAAEEREQATRDLLRQREAEHAVELRMTRDAHEAELSRRDERERRLHDAVSTLRDVVLDEVMDVANDRPIAPPEPKARLTYDSAADTDDTDDLGV